jgi:hypothetical protein
MFSCKQPQMMNDPIISSLEGFATNNFPRLYRERLLVLVDEVPALPGGLATTDGDVPGDKDRKDWRGTTRENVCHARFLLPLEDPIYRNELQGRVLDLPGRDVPTAA